jgi:hypothetical protein
MIARIALWEPPMMAIVIALSRGSMSESTLGLRTVSRLSSVRVVVDDPAPAPDGDGDGDGRDFGDEPVQRIRRGVETSMLEDESVEWIRTVHLDFFTPFTLTHISVQVGHTVLTHIIFEIGTHHFPTKRRDLFHFH